MWSWNQFRNLPKNQTLSAAEQARQYFIHQSNMMMEASINNSVSVSAAGSAGGSQKSEITTTLRLLFDDISNADMIVGDSSSVDDWNIFFDLPNLGVAFTSVEISGNEVSLIGGSNIKVKPGLMYSYTENVFLIKIEDTGSITSVGGDAFAYCDGLTDVVLPECTIMGGLSNFDGFCFSGCTSLTTINLPALTTVGDCCFYYCTSLTTIDLPNLTTAGGHCFNNSGLTTVSLPTLTTAGDQCFNECTLLTSISLPTLTTAGDQFFQSCNSLTTVDLPTLTTAGDQFFQSCNSLTTVDLPTLTTAGDQCFNECTLLTSISLPLCTSLGSSVGINQVFGNISGNTITLTIPASLMTINGGDPDEDIQKLTSANTVTIITT